MNSAITFSCVSVENFSLDYMYEFKSLVALSNAGVTLIQNGAYEEAEQVQKDAIMGLRIFFNEKGAINSPPVLSREAFRQDISTKVSGADRLVASVTPSNQVMRECNEISLDYACFASVEGLLQGTLAPTKLERPIRIVNCSTNYTMEEIEIVSSIALFNYGVIRRLQARQAKEPSLAILMMEGSSKLLGLSLASLQVQYNRCTDDTHLSLIVSISALVLGNLEFVSLHLGDQYGALTHRTILSNVYRVASTLLQKVCTVRGHAERRHAPAA
jgi:hypothetical protein